MSLTKITNRLVGSSLKTAISGSDIAESSSFSTRTTTLESASGSFSTRTTALESDSGSFSTRTTTVEGRVNQGVKTTDSPTFAGGTVTGNLSVGGTLTAQEVHTEFESASIIFTSGSTIFGNSSDDIHNMTGSLNISGSLTLDDGNLVINDKVGIGTDNPDSYYSDYNNLVVYENGNAGIAIIGGTNGESSLGFGDGTGAATYRGAVAYVHTSGANQDKMFFKTAATNQVVIDSSGQVGIGTLAPGNPLHLYSDTYPQLSIDGTDNSGNIGFVLSGSGGRGGMRWNGSNNDVEILREGGAVEISLLDGGGTQINNSNLSAKMTTAGSGIRVIADRVDTSDFAGFEARTGGSQRWFIGVREDSTENLHFYNGNSSGTVQNVLTLNHSNSQATFASRVTLSNDGSDHGLFLGGGWQIFDNASEAFGTAGDLIFYHGATRVVMPDDGGVKIKQGTAGSIAKGFSIENAADTNTSIALFEENTSPTSGELRLYSGGSEIVYLRANSDSSSAFILKGGQRQDITANNTGIQYRANWDTGFINRIDNNFDGASAASSYMRVKVASGAGSQNTVLTMYGDGSARCEGNFTSAGGVVDGDSGLKTQQAEFKRLTSNSFSNGNLHDLTQVHQRTFIVKVEDSAGGLSTMGFPIGGSGIAYNWSLFDSDSNTWTSNQATITSTGTSGNTYHFTFNSGSGMLRIQRTNGSLSFTVRVYQIAE